MAIVDTFTGRVLEGRRWSDGMHQAIECKENISVSFLVVPSSLQIKRMIKDDNGWMCCFGSTCSTLLETT